MPRSEAILLADLAFGDTGKGTLIDFLARRTGAHTVVRFNGGPQAGHNVVTPDGRHHTFSQLGSATFLPEVRTLLSRFMLVEPYALLNEARHLGQIGVSDPLARLHIARRCRVITPAHQAANRLRELARGRHAHGTCGQGVGETVQDDLEHPDLTLHAQDLPDRARCRQKLEAFVGLKREQLGKCLPQLSTQHSSLSTLTDPSWIDAAVDNYAHLAGRVTLVDDGAVNAMLTASGTILFEPA